ncbi:MAG: HAD family hydrolase, partial [Clostridia bacterium]
DSIDNIIDEIGAQISEAYRCDVIAKPGALELLTALKKADFPIALATATGRDIFTPAITRLGMDRFFDYIITCSEIGASKQSAKIYNSCALKFNLPACDIVVFEDALYAAKTAKSAGYTLVGVHDKYAENDTAGLLEISDRYVNSLEELL